MTTVPVFDVRGPLPGVETVVLEASAGTGKTWTIASLAVRYVAELGVRLPELMLVTFGRAATTELRDRVRGRLVEVERGLRSPVARTSSDEVVALLADADPAEVTARRTRLAAALAEFDAATITTTHGFCQQMLAMLGTTSDVDHDATLLPDVADLEAEVADDLYLRTYAATTTPLVTVDTAREVMHAAVSDHAAVLEPGDAEPGTAPHHRFKLAEVARAEMRRRKRAAGVVDYDDLLTLLRDALVDPVTGPAARARVRAAFRVVMVDEFQDTDPVQWQILRSAFHGERTLVLIGDPKQAIYAFRGADVTTYLVAAAEARRATLARNHRADPAVLAGLRPVLEGAALGDPRIVVHPVEAQHRGRRLAGGPPVVLRQVTRTALGTRPGRVPPVGAVRDLLYADVAAQVVETLTTCRVPDDGTAPHGTAADGTAPDGTALAGRHDPPLRAVRPGEIAVLVRRNRDAQAVQRALAEAGVPAVISGLASVFGTRSAQHWLTLLSALARPDDSGLAAGAALTPFLGWTAAELALADDRARDRLAERVRTWAATLASHGVAALLEAAAATGMRARVVAAVDGERELTDLRHVGEALHAVAVHESLGASALLEWLRARIEEAGRDYAEERSRRLQTDAAAVQVITVHASKGLQFPVTLVPFAWDTWVPSEPAVLRFHRDDERTLHVGGPGSPGYAAGAVAHAEDDAGEQLRLTYVALTRARSQVVVWWAPSRNSERSPLSRLLLGARTPDGTPDAVVPVPTDEDATVRFAELAARTGGDLVLQVVDAPRARARWSPPATARPALELARLDRTVDLLWRRTSFTGLTAAAYDHRPHAPSSEPDDPGVQDEPDGPVTGTSALPAAGPVTPAQDDEERVARACASPLADLPAGTAFGTLVHHVLEHVDTTAPDLGAEVALRCAEADPGGSLGIDPEVLAARLLPALRTPLGPLMGGRTLADVPPGDRLAELDFELPLAGGDDRAAPGRPATLRAVADLLRAHLTADDPFAGYAARLEDPELAGGPLRGYLAGSIDAVLRVPAPDGGHTYVVVDYKTNRLGPWDEPLTAWHYRPSTLVDAMVEHHYPLQLLLYSAALHRFLRWRVRDYDPARHLGGALYLFVRGMTGPGTPVLDGPGGPSPAGVLAWRPPAALVTDLSDLLAGVR
ncbi:UvrD-helicase domain-containing protein [Cellulomonas gilvus]|uniref:RecBCD enzyme subunit RecB n=1 Tax=Cellulomonas gilvus (strain ATCC 13127 / NRRL B-14078) TaxID=593907 RepID=F8A107_CELGA|nr:UvrD-helicase domain-containing protein [Cellulomonas gilvus]AEI12765.1 Exodeoxyribonuclease V [Cellulomonas gilvus ATCC 13127]